ncbi:MAG: hypothetical protein ACLF0G_15205 [Candidatus Brocadiia bacterium]
MRPATAIALAFYALPAVAATDGAAFETPVTRECLDPQATAEWVDGETRRDVHFHHRPARDHPGWVVWTTDGGPGHSGIQFGASERPGRRHFRLGFARPVPAGTVFARGGGALAVLRPDAPYPGDPANETHWQPAERLHEGEYSLWVLPPETTVRALRFTVDSRDEMAAHHEGHLWGIYILERRLIDLAPEATIVASSGQDRAPFLADHRRGGWRQVWDNDWEARAAPVNPERPETILYLWPEAVPLRGLCALWAGLARARVEAYRGPPSLHPREAGPEHWSPLGTYELGHQYPRRFAPNWLDFGRRVATRAVRLTVTAPSPTEGVHGGVRDKPRGGRRVWLGELMALHELGERPVALPPAARPEPAADHPPVPIRFTLDEPGHVTLVIDDAQGRRVRNLIAETPFPAGQHTVWWDGLDEHRVNVRVHGIYDIRGRLVEPGTYRVRGLVRPALRLRYQMSPYSPGSPPWGTADGSGGWLADHTPPWDALYVPKGPSGQGEVLLTAWIVEHGHGLIGVDLRGRKLWGLRRLGGPWTGGSHLARDEGPTAQPGVVAYVGSWWRTGGRDEPGGEVRITALRDDGQGRTLLKHPMASQKEATLGGMAVRDGLLVASLPVAGTVLFVDAGRGELLGTQRLDEPRGLAFEGPGRLLVLEGTRLRRTTVRRKDGSPQLAAPQDLVARGLEDPHGLAVGPEGRLYVSDWGESHQVKVFSPQGKLLRTVGSPGGARLGPYDPTRMHRPRGMTLTPDGHLWVAEESISPKRVSVWTRDGDFVRAFYGPPKYGGGGVVDPADRSRFCYVTRDDVDGQRIRAGLAFRLDWQAMDWRPSGIYYLHDRMPLTLGDRWGAAPQRPIRHRGHDYMTNAFNARPTTSPPVVGVWLLRRGAAHLVAAAGSAAAFDALQRDDLAARLPQGVAWEDHQHPKRSNLFFAWSDRDLDGTLEPPELTFALLDSPSVGEGYIRPDLAMMFTYTDRLRPRGVTAQGVPLYHAEDVERAVPGEVEAHFTSGARVAIDAGHGWIVRTGAPIRGYRHGELVWTYPNRWPGLHASHQAPTPQHPGQIIGATRILGHPVAPRAGQAGPMWAVNGNFGNVYLMTLDGLFVATLGRDQRTGRLWRFPQAPRGLDVAGVSFYGEHFWPTMVRSSDGEIYLTAGKGHSSILRVEGLERVRRLPQQALAVTPDVLERCSAWRTRREARRLERRGRKTLEVALRTEAPTVDGTLDDWADAQWARVGDYPARKETRKVWAAVAVSRGRLYAAFRTADPRLLDNAAEDWHTLFKTGGALDLQLATDPAAEPQRKRPARGDLRLLAARVEGKTTAVLYRPVAPQAPDEEAVPFSSPWRTVTFDRVEQVSAQVTLAGEGGNYELSVPLATLGLEPQPGRIVRGDIGILRGEGGVTIQRLTWSNKATGIISDVPGEAMLHPHLWGRIRFVAPPE